MCPISPACHRLFLSQISWCGQRNLQVFVGQMQVDQSVFQAGVSEQDLDGAQVGSGVQQMGGATVPQTVWGQGFADAGLLGCLATSQPDDVGGDGDVGAFATVVKPLSIGQRGVGFAECVIQAPAPSLPPLSLSEESGWVGNSAIRHRANCRNQLDPRMPQRSRSLCRSPAEKLDFLFRKKEGGLRRPQTSLHGAAMLPDEVQGFVERTWRKSSSII